MPQLNMIVGLILVLLGVVGYFASGRASWTALIPAILGALFVLLGLLAGRANLRRHAMHAAAVVALLGLAGTAKGVIEVAKLAAGQTLPRPAASVAKSITALLCAVLLVAAISSFVKARRARAVR